jgi:vWA-MoxR associated protein C-terminal domain/Trypsin-like peptidase domain/vWA-MoxR associated protein middle region (VMAP-M) 1
MTFSMDDYERAIARIFDQNNNVIGTGFLVAPGYVLTCAHVVLQAIGIKKEDFAAYRGQPQEYISLDFHVLASGQEIKAQVVDWLPYSLHTGDVAALKLLIPEPIRAKPIPLEEVERSVVENDHHSVYGFGKSPTGGRSDAYRPKSNVAGGRFQLCKFDNPDDETIKPGFSGAPVWNEKHKYVIGMVATASEAQEVAYAIPTQELRAILNKIKALCLNDVLTQSLNSCKNIDYEHLLELAIASALRYCNPNGGNLSRRDQLIDLSTDRAPVSGWETEGQLVRFVMVLVQMDGIRENTYYPLKSWVENLCHVDFNGLLGKITEERVINREIPSSNIYQYLMVVVEEAELPLDELRVSIWPVSDRDTYNPENPPLPTVADEILKIVDLPALIREQMRKFRKDPTPIIHLFLPRKLFGCDIEMRSCGSKVNVLGSMYEFVIRTNLNTHPIDYQSYYDDWIIKWQKIEAALEHHTSQLFKPVDCSQSEANLIWEIAKINAAVLKNHHSPESIGELFGLIGDEDTALPMAIWTRDHQFQDNLSDVLDCVVKALQDRVRQERSAAHESPSENLLGHHLSLLWEDPKVLPPGMLDVDQEGMLRI